MNLQTPIGPGLPIAVARQFAFDQIDTKVSVDPKLAVAFWDEVSGSAPPAQPDITVFYCFLQFEVSSEIPSRFRQDPLWLKRRKSGVPNSI